MDPNHDSPSDRFCSTRWTAVLLSAQTQAPGSQEALAQLCGIYWYPIYAFVRSRGYDVDDAQDLTQSFFLHLLEHKSLRQVSPLKGKFRSFLVASMQNFLSNQAACARRLKRGGNLEFVPLDTRLAEDRYRLVPVDFVSPGNIFDAQWAMTLLDEAMRRLREENGAKGKASKFKTLEPFLDPINCNASLSYEQIAQTLRVSVGSVKILIHRLRSRYAALLREEVARTVCDPREIDEEIHSLCQALIATNGRSGS